MNSNVDEESTGPEGMADVADHGGVVADVGMAEDAHGGVDGGGPNGQGDGITGGDEEPYRGVPELADGEVDADCAPAVAGESRGAGAGAAAFLPPAHLAS